MPAGGAGLRGRLGVAGPGGGAGAPGAGGYPGLFAARLCVRSWSRGSHLRVVGGAQLAGRPVPQSSLFSRGRSLSRPGNAGSGRAARSLRRLLAALRRAPSAPTALRRGPIFGPSSSAPRARTWSCEEAGLTPWGSSGLKRAFPISVRAGGWVLGAGCRRSGLAPRWRPRGSGPRSSPLSSGRVGARVTGWSKRRRARRVVGSRRICPDEP